MRGESLPLRLKTYLLAATITAHACYANEGFRQRDLKFYLDLFLDWMNSPFTDGLELIHNTQILRFLEFLETEGNIKKSTRQKQPRYKLTRVGLIESIRLLTEQKHPYQHDELLFICYFIANYSNKIIDLIKAEGLEFPPGMQLEINRLLNYQALVKRQIQKLEKHLELLKDKIVSNQKAILLAEKLIREKKDADQITQILEKQHPYNLNSQKPLTKLISEIPADLRITELTSGSKNRETFIWQKQTESYASMLKQLKSLL